MLKITIRPYDPLAEETLASLLGDFLSRQGLSTTLILSGEEVPPTAPSFAPLVPWTQRKENEIFIIRK
jgi:hypothetical protein